MKEFNIKHNLDAYKSAELIIKEGVAGITFLQRRMCFGYPKSKEIIDELCNEGILTKIQEEDGYRYQVNIKDLEEFYGKYQQPNK